MFLVTNRQMDAWNDDNTNRCCMPMAVEGKNCFIGNEGFLLDKMELNERVKKNMYSHWNPYCMFNIHNGTTPMMPILYY